MYHSLRVCKIICIYLWSGGVPKKIYMINVDCSCVVVVVVIESVVVDLGDEIKDYSFDEHIS